VVLLGAFMVLSLVVYPPIAKEVLLRYYYPAEEIERQHLHVVRIVGKREVVFSNGEHKAYEERAKLLLVGTCLGLSLPAFGLVCWALARSGNMLMARPRPGGSVGVPGDPAKQAARNRRFGAAS
jgi:hypothetical protein